MGYQKGSPDLLIFHRNRKFDGLAIEFKSPKGGKISDEQNKVLKALEENRWDIMVSNDLFDIIERICKHMNQYQLPPKRQKKVKPVMIQSKSILDYINEDDSQMKMI